jgi:uncharacterized membrane protein (UPF0127 family)
MHRTRALALAFVIIAMVAPPLAAQSTARDVASNAGDPVGMLACDLSPGSARVTIANRTRHDLLSVVLHFVDLNHEGKPIGGFEVAYAPNPALAGGQSARYDVTMNEIPLYGGTANDVAQQSCSVESAMLSGNHLWAEGQSWAEPLVAAAPPTSSVAPPAAPAPRPAAPAAPPFTVLASWTTASANAMYLHVRVNLHPGATTTTKSSDFRVVTTSPTGGSETEYGLDEPAPMYLKVDSVGGFLAALQKTATATPTPVPMHAVAPSEDLGAQGNVQVVAGDPITEVVTFAVRPDTDVDAARIAGAISWLPAQGVEESPPEPASESNPRVRVSLANGGTLQLDVFNSAAARATGLAGRTSLAPHTGALYPAASSDGTLVLRSSKRPFGLDIVFVRCDATISGIRQVPATAAGMAAPPIPQVSGYGCWMIALPIGEAAADGFRVGSHITNLPPYTP